MTVRTALRMSPAHLRGSRLLNQSRGLGMSGSCGSTWGSVPGGCGTDSEAGAAAGPAGGEPYRRGRSRRGARAADLRGTVVMRCAAGAASGAPAKTSSASASPSVVSGPSAWAGAAASAPTMRATATVTPTSRPRMAPPFRRLPPAPSRAVYQAVVRASVRPASPISVQESGPISPIWGRSTPISVQGTSSVMEHGRLGRCLPISRVPSPAL